MATISNPAHTIHFFDADQRKLSFYEIQGGYVVRVQAYNTNRALVEYEVGRANITVRVARVGVSTLMGQLQNYRFSELSFVQQRAVVNKQPTQDAVKEIYTEVSHLDRLGKIVSFTLAV